MQSIYIYKSEFVRFVAPSDLSRRPTLSEKILMRRVIVIEQCIQYIVRVIREEGGLFFLPGHFNPGKFLLCYIFIHD